jgi:hypothetical protein
MQIGWSNTYGAEIFLNTQKTDILSVSKTRFTEQNYVKIPTYTTYITNHLDR